MITEFESIWNAIKVMPNFGHFSTIEDFGPSVGARWAQRDFKRQTKK
jgi:hypothetical protein